MSAPTPPEREVTASATPRASALPSEVIVIGALVAIVAVEILTTYTRVSPTEFYYVSGSGFGLATRQLLLFLGFPTGLLAIAVAGIVADGTSSRRIVRAAAAAALLGFMAVAVGGWDETEVSLRPLSSLGIAAVVAAAGISWLTLRRFGREPIVRRVRGDGLRAGIAFALALIAIPWLLADLGFSTDQVPGLRSVFINEGLRPDPGGPRPFWAVHDGHHHGMDGVLLAWAALLFSRVLPRLRRRGLRRWARAYLALVFAFGMANAVQDFWTEQLFKRGAVSVDMPRFTSVTLSSHWLVLVAAAAAVFVASAPLCRPSSKCERGQSSPAPL